MNVLIFRDSGRTYGGTHEKLPGIIRIFLLLLRNNIWLYLLLLWSPVLMILMSINHRRKGPGPVGSFLPRSFSALLPLLVLPPRPV